MCKPTTSEDVIIEFDVLWATVEAAIHVMEMATDGKDADSVSVALQYQYWRCRDAAARSGFFQRT